VPVAALSESRSFRVPKTSDLVAGHLRRRIVRGELREGEQLPPESVLIEQFAVSRPTLREAFRVLESEGLITVRRGTQGGARVHVPTVEMAAGYAGLVLQSNGATLAEVLDARTLIEPPLAAVIAERSDRKRSAATLRKYMKEHTLTPDDPQYTAEFHGFNRLLMTLTGNDAVVLVTAMLEAIADIAALRFRQTGDMEVSRAMELHQRAVKTRLKLADLIAAGDGAGAERLWRAHLDEAAAEIAAGAGAQVIDVVG
jgi:DNA-binding FadR family transcriptional regulator